MFTVLKDGAWWSDGRTSLLLTDGRETEAIGSLIHKIISHV